MRQLDIHKIGAVTRVEERYTEDPTYLRIINAGCESYVLKKGKIKFKNLGLSFSVSELANNFGAQNNVDLANKFAQMGFFTTSNGNAISGFVEVNITENSDMVQNDLLKNKSAINMVVVGNSINQNIIGYDPQAGSFVLNVFQGETLLVFFTN